MIKLYKIITKTEKLAERMLPLNTITFLLFGWTYSSFCFLISHVWHGDQTQFLDLPISVLKTVSIVWNLLSKAPPAKADQSRWWWWWWWRTNNIGGIDKKTFGTIPNVNIGKWSGFVVVFYKIWVCCYIHPYHIRRITTLFRGHLFMFVGIFE